MGEREAEEAALSAERRQAAEALLALPEVDSGAERCHLVLRFPNGRRADRSFGADEELSRVYAWAACSGELSGLQGGECFEVPRSFTLARTYPRALLQDRSQSLRSLQLLPNAVLALCPEDT